MSNSKTTIHEFDLGIYPRKIWVAFNCPKEVLNDLFEDKFEDMDKSCDAVTYSCRRLKPDIKGGELILFRNKKAMTTGNIAHEAFHAALDIIDYIGGRIDYDNQEYPAYLVGYIAKCCQQVKDNKFED